MSISLNGHETRISALEKSSTNSSIRYELNSNGSKGCIYFGNLMFNFGHKGDKTSDTFFKPFPSKLLIILNCHNGGGQYASDARITSSSLTGFTSNKGQASNWIAIGYLITNSIRSLLGGGLGWLSL